MDAIGYLDYVFYKNGTYKLIEDDTKLKPKKISFILFQMESNLFGQAYLKVSYKAYKKINKIRKCSIAYHFLDGEWSGDDDELESLTVYNKYIYDSTRYLLAKILEIVISENILYDLFQSRSCFYYYTFIDILVKITTNKDKYKFDFINNFFKHIKICDDAPYGIPEPVYSILTLNDDNTYQVGSPNKKSLNRLKSSANKDTIWMTKLYRNVYLTVNKKLFNINKLEISSVLNLVDNCYKELHPDDDLYEDCVFDDYETSYDGKHIYTIVETYLAREVVRRLNVNFPEVEYKLVNNVTKCEYKHEKMKIDKFGKFVRDMFTGIS